MGGDSPAEQVVEQDSGVVTEEERPVDARVSGATERLRDRS